MSLHSGCETPVVSCATAPILPLQTVDPDSENRTDVCLGSTCRLVRPFPCRRSPPELEEHPLPHAAVPLPEFPAPELPGPRVSAPLLESLAPELDSGA